MRWIYQQAGKLADMAEGAGLLLTDGEGVPVGYQGESDPCADDALSLLCAELNELKAGLARGLYPAPWPPSVDMTDSRTVFAVGRLLNGKFLA